jgi:ribosomal protein S18 acetylase RimI-like enzyme
VPAQPRTTTTEAVAPTTAEAASRAIAWRHADHARLCDVLEPWAHGTSVRCTRLPDFWDYNSLRVEGPAPGVGVDTLVHTADVHQGGLSHRQIEVEDEAAGARLRPDFEALGWTASRLVWMCLHGSAPPGPAFEQLAFADTRELRLAWHRGTPWTPAERSLREFARTEEAAAEILGTRAVVARDGAGAAIGFAAYVAAGDAAEVTQAYVAPAFRGRGIGGALVAAAARAAGAAETFIVADDEGDPKRLYERLGFAPVWRQHTFTRRPG